MIFLNHYESFFTIAALSLPSLWMLYYIDLAALFGKTRKGHSYMEIDSIKANHYEKTQFS